MSDQEQETHMVDEEGASGADREMVEVEQTETVKTTTEGEPAQGEDGS